MNETTVSTPGESPFTELIETVRRINSKLDDFIERTEPES